MRVVVVCAAVGEGVGEDAAGRPRGGYDGEPGGYGAGFEGRVDEMIGAGPWSKVESGVRGGEGGGGASKEEEGESYAVEL